jgi:hypothetical protein
MVVLMDGGAKPLKLIQTQRLSEDVSFGTFLYNILYIYICLRISGRVYSKHDLNFG